MALNFEFVLILAIVYGTSYVFKFLERYDIPILVVEILAGIVFGSFLGIIGPNTPGYEFLVSIAAFGLLVIMFEAGLELDPGLIRDDPLTVGKFGVVTFVVPFVAGVGLGFVVGLSVFASFLVGVTISTTSLGLVYPLLNDFGYIETERGQLILSVAVLNDVLSVVTLSFAISLTSTDPFVGTVIVTAILLVFFVALPVVLVERLERFVPEAINTNPTKFAVFLIAIFALLMELAGVHAILGGFFAGLLIAELTHESYEIGQAMDPVVNLAAPVFFFFVGMQFQIRGVTVADLWLIAGIVVVGIGTKMVGSALGGALTGSDRETTLLFMAVMPGRLAISVAAAEIGLARGIITPLLYDAFLILSTLSVFVASLTFRYVAHSEVTSGVPESAKSY